MRLRRMATALSVAAVLAVVLGGPALAKDDWDRYGIRYPATSGTVTGSWYYTNNSSNGNFAPNCQIQAGTRIVLNYGTVTGAYVAIRSVSVTYKVTSYTVGDIRVPPHNLQITDGSTGATDSYSGSGQGYTIYSLTGLGATLTLTYPVNKTYHIGANTSSWYAFTKLRVNISAPVFDCTDADMMLIYSYYSKPL